MPPQALRGLFFLIIPRAGLTSPVDPGPSGPPESVVEARRVLGYDGPEVQRVTHIMQVIFWVSVPLFAVYLAVSWALGAEDALASRPGLTLWLVVFGSSGFLTGKLGLPASSLEESRELPEPSSAGSPSRASEWLVYAVVFYLAVFLFAGQIIIL